MRFIMMAVLGTLVSAPAFAQETLRQYLSGTDKDDAVPWEFYCTAGRNSGKWTTIPVPSNWEFHGFGNFSYRRDDLKKPVESGQYRHEFEIPADWAGRRIFIVFDGSMTDTTVKINGQLAGPKHQGAFYRFEYDITSIVKIGAKNRLEATVEKLSSEPTVNKAERQGDYWVFGGIFRPVWLEAMPREFIDHIAVDARADGNIAIDASPVGIQAVDRIIARVHGGKIDVTFSVPLKAGQTSARLGTKIDNISPWTSETPTLYTLDVSLQRADQVIHTVQKRIGFRTVEIRPSDGIYINGARIMLKGCDRHSFWPDSGRCLSRKISELDVGLMKQMNMNAVRMSHYPPDEHFLDVCDEQGLYVLDELAGWHQAYGTEIGQKLVREMVQRDVNHPSVIIWDNGNEGGWNTALDGEFANYDPQKRQVIHPWAAMGPTNTKHYPDWPALQKLLAGDAVYFPTEFLHGLYDGGAGAGLADYWEAMRRSKVCAGGFIWALVDEGARRDDLGGKIDTAGNQGPDGIVGPYRQKEGSFYTIKQVWSPVAIRLNRFGTDGEWAFSVENRYHFTSLDQCSFTWRYQIGTRDSVITEGKFPSPRTSNNTPVLPGQTGELTFQQPQRARNANILAITATDPGGREIFTWSYPTVGILQRFNIALAMTKPGNAPASAEEDADSVTLRADQTAVRIGKARGQILSIQNAQREFSLKNGPRLVVGAAQIQKVTLRQDANDRIVDVACSGDMKSMTWRMRDNGWLRLDYEYTASGPQPYLGITFDWPESKMKKVQWLGLGPYRVWKNRMEGPQFGLWENEYNDTLAGYQTWKFPEFRGYFGDVRWMKLSSDEGTMIVVMGQENTFLRLGADPKITDKKAAYMNAEPTFPPGDISFLHAIPPIGNKFHPAKNVGPGSQLSQASGTYRGTLYFRFER